MHTQRPRHLNLALLPALLAAAGAKPRGHGAQPGSDEIQFSSEEFKKLDTFEAHALNKGDEAYAKKDYKKAAAEYDAFLVEFPKSRATAYAILRKARCLHQEITPQAQRRGCVGRNGWKGQ
jgi:TolA-binding protein